MTDKIKQLVLEATLEDGTVQRLDIEGHVNISTKATFELSATPPYAKNVRTITIASIPESAITEKVTGPQSFQRTNPLPEPKFSVGDIISLPGTHRFGGRPRHTPTHYEVVKAIWLEVNHRWTFELQTRDGLAVGGMDQSQISAATKVGSWPVRKGDFVRFKSRIEPETIFKVGERAESGGEGHYLIRPNGSVTQLPWTDPYLEVIPREQIKVRKTFELA